MAEAPEENSPEEGGEEKIEGDFQPVGPWRDLDMEGEHVNVIPPPGDRLAQGAHFQAAQVGDRAVRLVLARNPFRVKQRDRAGMDGELQMRVQNFPRRIRGVHFQFDGGFLGQGRRRQP